MRVPGDILERRTHVGLLVGEGRRAVDDPGIENPIGLYERGAIVIFRITQLRFGDLLSANELQ
jgi:hypothetical protein